MRRGTEDLGEALKWLRTRRGWPQKQLARLAKVTNSMVSSYETGKQTPTLATLHKLLRALGADFCDLFCALEHVHGRPAAGHELSQHFHVGQVRVAQLPARRAPAPDPVASLAAALGPAGETASELQLPDDLERALSETPAIVHTLLRHHFLRFAKPR
jgi:transcriptional regulator with XRE-family HTH domain